MDMDFFFNSYYLLPLAVVVIYALWGRRPLPLFNLPTPDLDMTLAFDALRYEIDYLLETLFKERFGEGYVLPDGLTFSAVGEHLYSQIETLQGLQEVFLSLLFEGGQSPFFLTALEFVLNWVV